MLKSLRRTPDIARVAGPLMSDSEFFGRLNAEAHFSGCSNPLVLPAFYRGLRHRTGIISSLPLQVQLDDSPVDVTFPIVEQPDPSEDRMVTLSRLEASLVLRGEFVCVLGAFDEIGFPQALKVVDPAVCTLNKDGTWLIGGKTFMPSEVLHRIAMGVPGETRGCSIEERFRRTISAEITAQEFQGNFYKDGGQPTTILTNSDPEATPKDMEAMLQRYKSKVSGGRREPIVVPSSVKIESLTLSNADSQFLESRQFALVDIANIVGVPGYFVGAPGSSSTYSNLTDQRRDLIDVYLRDDLYSIERGLSSLIPEGLKVKFNPKSFLRLDPKAEAETLQIQSGWMTVDEVRAVQGLDPLPDGQGKVIASTTLPGAAPAPTPAPAPAPSGAAQ